MVIWTMHMEWVATNSVFFFWKTFWKNFVYSATNAYWFYFDQLFFLFSLKQHAHMFWIRPLTENPIQEQERFRMKVLFRFLPIHDLVHYLLIVQEFLGNINYFWNYQICLRFFWSSVLFFWSYSCYIFEFSDPIRLGAVAFEMVGLFAYISFPVAQQTVTTGPSKIIARILLSSSLGKWTVKMTRGKLPLMAESK